MSIEALKASFLYLPRYWWPKIEAPSDDEVQPFAGLDEFTPAERQMFLLAFLVSDKGKDFMERSSTKAMIKGFFDMQKYLIQSGSKNPAMGLVASVVNARLWNILGVLDDLTLKILYVAMAFEKGTDLLSDITSIATKLKGGFGLEGTGDTGAIHFSDEYVFTGEELSKRVLRLKGVAKE